MSTLLWDEPHAYSIMFELEPPEGQQSEAESRCWQVFRDTIQAAITKKQLRGEPNTMAHLFWGGLHGLVALHLAREAATRSLIGRTRRTYD